ncbi:UDP-glucose 4-epimerase GalE [Tardiphaga robiniae]|uniref:UDP-glucose 4-epimerase n=1 Tax=Tardiphaga robiniae TaxID=943830 RepID=A0A7G6TUJ2_9BRAD|nr:UDP-glucose 4-epimerase GalE [Tardiphaga robiniae]QND70424.1 UDP-glucose 4-epimerase GalE [Tardiphaga robiniae]
MIESRSVLVAGGAGYIGSHCCKALSEAGFVPICFDNLSTGHRDFVRWGPLVVGDVHDHALVAETLRRYDVVAVMHFAASSLVGESVADPEKYYLNNTVGTLSLLRAMRSADCLRLVFSSTGAVYGEASEGLIREDAPCIPVNPYGSSKHMIEQMLADYRRAYQMNSFVLRYFNASGADRSGYLGELRDPETHLIPRALMALQGHVSDFAVFGTDYGTPDGTAIRDYIHVADLATAHVSALHLLLQGHVGGRFNLGTGVGFSVAEILSAIAKVTGKQVPLTHKSRRTGDPAFLVADASAARDILGFRPQFSDIDSIVTDAWNWHRTAHPAR